MKALGTWGERWMELAPEHLDPGVVLHSWVSWYLAHEQLPDRRVVVHFRFPGLPKKGAELWIIFDGEHSEVCRKDPGFEVDLYVQAKPAALAEWHLGRTEWADALRAERIRLLGPAALARSPRSLPRSPSRSHPPRTARRRRRARRCTNRSWSTTSSGVGRRRLP